MSILSNILDDILAVIYPPRCLVCGEPLHTPGSQICTRCFGTISFTRFWEHTDNAMAQHARDMQPIIENASALLYFDSYSRPMIHRLKYSGEWHTAKYLGELLGAYLSTSPLYASVDVVIPVPLHLLRRLGRTYNQSEYIALGVASKLGAKTNFRALYRQRYTSSQTQKSRKDRWGGDSELFGLRELDSLRGKHILLVDDVYTTGATIFRCVESLYYAIPNCKISIATLATSTRFGV